MRKLLGYLCCTIMVFSLGCGTIKKVVGWGESDSGEPKKPAQPKIIPPSNPVKITSTTLSNLALYLLITLVILFGIRHIINREK
tara:strand:+ start:5264 stop:5515 length:252 start_codon:yes stop_codon:yes gene_type:complete